MNKAMKKLLGLESPENQAFLKDIEKALEETEEALINTIPAEGSALASDLNRIISSGGKRLRPVLGFLGYMVGAQDDIYKEKMYPVVPLMTAAELIHTSSLIHDDIIDRASVRRSAVTIHETSGVKRAVQAGDYLLSKASRMAMHYKGLEAEKRFASIAVQMCIAEFMQIESAHKLEKDSLERYYGQIKRKTAGFISAILTLGGCAGGASEETAAALESYGNDIGIAFQIRDDILDFESDRDFGKKCGQDIKRGIFTLPLLIAVNDEDIPEVKREQLKKLVMSETLDDGKIKKILETVKSSGALLKAQREIEILTENAVDTASKLKDSCAKGALICLANGLAVRRI